jgi:hypothetical protein
MNLLTGLVSPGELSSTAPNLVVDLLISSAQIWYNPCYNFHIFFLCPRRQRGNHSRFYLGRVWLGSTVRCDSRLVAHRFGQTHTPQWSDLARDLAHATTPRFIFDAVMWPCGWERTTRLLTGVGIIWACSLIFQINSINFKTYINVVWLLYLIYG